MRVVVEQVLQVATRLSEHRLTAREAATILSTLTRDAVVAAGALREAEPERAQAYRELILVIGRELRSHQDESDQPGHLRAVTDDLARVLRALEP